MYIKTAARYRKGYEMLEPYAVKVARTVPRRGRTGNRSSLFDKYAAYAKGIYYPGLRLLRDRQYIKPSTYVGRYTRFFKEQCI